MARAALLTTTLLWAFPPAQTIEIYRAQNRPAAELVAIARSALGSGGDVTLDARTATLVLNGSSAAVRRALELLEQMDQPLRGVILTSNIHEVDDVDAMGARVSWQVSLGPLRIGTLPAPPDSLQLAASGRRTRARVSSRTVLRMMEGTTGVIRSGEALPILFAPYWGSGASTSFVPVETGFEIEARILGDGNVHLELHPFAGRLEENGALNYIAAATALIVPPGETVVVAEASRQSTSSSVGPSTVESRDEAHQQVIFVSVEVVR